MVLEASRIERLLESLVAATGGDYSVRVPLEEHDDTLLEVEIAVNYMLEELAARREQNAAQRELLVANARRLAEQQDELVAALSTPILTLWPGVLALPLIGRIDEARAASITATVLERVVDQRATHVLIDLTGIDTLAAATMPALLRMVQAIGLLGAACLLTGIRPALARQLAELPADAAPLHTLAHMSDALALVLAGRRARP